MLLECTFDPVRAVSKGQMRKVKIYELNRKEGKEEKIIK
jgi:hypothetical protein